jgi:hypothetical protein
MKLTIEFSELEIAKMQAILSMLQNEEIQTEPDNEKPDVDERLKWYSEKYLTSTGLTELAVWEYSQNHQHAVVSQILRDVRDGIQMFSNDKGRLLLSADPHKVASTNCNLNMRILVANNFLARNCLPVLTFREAWVKILENNGTLPGKVNAVNADLYRAMLADITSFTILTESNPAKFTEFINNNTNKLIRAWTVSNTGTHATGLFNDCTDVYCIDTAVKTRNKKIDIAGSTSIHGRPINHLETLN